MILVGRAPWPAADPLVGPLGRRKSRTRGSGADEGVRPTFGCGYAALWGRMKSCGRLSIGPAESCTSPPEGRLTIGRRISSDFIFPRHGSCSFRIDAEYPPHL